MDPRAAGETGRAESHRDRERWKLRAPGGSRRRPGAAFAAVVLLLAGLTLAIANSSTPGFHASTLPLAGSFFALASSGPTLYAASDNGGSILLEKSNDRGSDWTANPVPYSAVAGGAPWQYAAVAVQGSDVVLTAATGGPVNAYNIYPGYPATPAATSYGTQCGTNSTILVASSTDGGSSWNTTTLSTNNLSVTSLQVGIEGATAAVAWVGTTTDCNAPLARVGALASHDAGQTWTSLQGLARPGDAVTVGQGIEMAPENHGLLVGFRVSSAATGASLLSLWQLADSGSSGFAMVTELPAPSSWTLQGDPGTPAYLLTPTYLIPLVAPPYTAIPFNELQTDGGGIGVLPRVVALVATGPGTVEIAATTQDNLGVDCWQVDTVHDSVARSCHVAINSPLVSSAPALPIVALIDGGGWWAAIGASGFDCGPGCYPPPGPVSSPPVPSGSASGSSVGTSVCITGCSSAQGLAAYSYTQSSPAGPAILSAAAALLAGTGVLALVWVVVSGRRRAARDLPPKDAAAPGASPTDPEYPLRPLRRLYLGALAARVIAWLPLGFLAFGSTSPPSPGSLLAAILFGGIVGTLISFPFHHLLRQRLQRTNGLFEDQLLGGSPAGPVGAAFERVRWTSYLAYASWGAGFLVVVSFWVLLIAGGGAIGPPSAGADLSALPPAGEAVLASLLAFLALRVLYYVGVERSVADTAGPVGGGATPVVRRAVQLRTWIGAALLPCNPLVGLILGVALQSALPWSPYALAWGLLPVTLLGAALLGGGFGRTTSSPALALP